MIEFLDSIAERFSRALYFGSDPASPRRRSWPRFLLLAFLEALCVGLIIYLIFL